jgi:hypothetical protein
MCISRRSGRGRAGGNFDILIFEGGKFAISINLDDRLDIYRYYIHSAINMSHVAHM